MEQGDEYPALTYFNKTTSRSEFIKQVYSWARVFKGIGVKQGEIVSVHGVWTPEISYIVFALNLVGAVPYFLKLDISKENLENETKESRYAIALDVMWDVVKDVFTEERFEQVILLSVSDSMPFAVKAAYKIKNSKNLTSILEHKNVISVKDTFKIYSKYDGEIKSKYVPNKTAFITSSSGTTIGGPVKGVETTNEAVISQILQADAAEVNYKPGKLSLAFLSPTAATALVCAYFYGLYFNMTVLIEPRINSSEAYGKYMSMHRPEVSIMTGSWWEKYFLSIEEEIKKNKNVDLSFMDMPIVGGEGSTTEDFNWMNEILRKCGSTVPLFSGYGLSEMTSVMTVWKNTIPASLLESKKSVIQVGIPYPAITVGVFDSEGNELGYNRSGELWVKGDSMAKGYYRKEELTKNTFIDGWMHTGDIFEIDENGLLYYHGRMTDSIVAPNGEVKYLFDIADELKTDANIRYSMVNKMILDGKETLAAHIVLYDDTVEIRSVLDRLDNLMSRYLPDGMAIDGYKFHTGMFRTSPTTAKKDRNSYANEKTGYIKLIDGKLIDVAFD